MSRNRYSSDGRLMDYYSRKQRFNTGCQILIWAPMVLMVLIYWAVKVVGWLKSVFGG